MTRTEWIFSDENHSLHQEFPTEDSASNPSDNTNPAELIIDFPVSFSLTQGHTGDDAFSQLSIDIPADIMDRMAIAWCKKRRLHGALEGPVGREFGSVDCAYDEQASERLEEDAELRELVKDRAGQPEIQANLEFGNIFEVVANTKEEARQLKEESDKLIQNRNINEAIRERSMLPTRHKRAASGILDHIKSNQNVNDELSLLSVIEEAFLANYIISSDEDFLDSTWQFEDKLAAGIYAPGLGVNGRWILVGKGSRNETIVTALEPLSVKVVERLIQQKKLIPEASPKWITPQLQVTMYG
ncbi:hypothetical protein [Alteromonas sp. MmMcT2-5]|uniref:Uncharacterized protein n=2 Tax=Alteromonas macleodii TaxID=28108 RepID=A0A126Q086_ALTMA|nr:hypothetical protein [Alteromonas sp. MmMcT2-5]AMJ98450.1 hypothetical protein AVL55_09905 [Alteromonas macleodii]MCG7651872.1 hypothetical protein [Alteromonas sp. MmMcT2-5]